MSEAHTEPRPAAEHFQPICRIGSLRIFLDDSIRLRTMSQDGRIQLDAEVVKVRKRLVQIGADRGADAD